MAVKSLDDPDHINTFLLMIGASPIAPRVATTVQNEENEKPPSTEQAITVSNDNEKESLGTVTPEIRSRAHSTASSPAVGTKAPPPTPVNTHVTAEAAAKLEPIEEDETEILAKLAKESKLGLNDSRFASKGGLHYPAVEYRPGGLPKTSYSQRNLGHAEITSNSTSKIEKDMVIDEPPKGYIEQVVSEFQKKQNNHLKRDGGALAEHSDLRVPTSVAAETPLTPSKDKYKVEKPNPIEKVSQDVKTAESKSIAADAAGSDASPSKAQETALDTFELQTEEEDWQYLTHFKSWGKPEARDKPAAQVRRLMLSSLPADADLTLIQSLIHGGAIDDMVLMGASGVAYVRLTSGDACDTYCAKYPNGLIFKYRGRSHTLFVDKCKDVDVISGMLQGYINCGASRCVRAIGADEDWGMGALRKLAEGKNRKGKVENITDVYRNGIRTVVFRFTSIGEAVAFKGMLMRDENWEACNIQFAADPCEKATCVHFE